MILVIRKISLIKLIEGGPAILAAARRNQRKEREGAIVKRPLERIMLRVLVDS